jgi:DNA-binding MarR family transcriptional regulator
MDPNSYNSNSIEVTSTALGSEVNFKPAPQDTPVAAISSPFIAKLLNEYQNRKKLNPRYSLRAFAKLLQIDQSLLSKTINGNRAPSDQLIGKAGVILGWPLETIRYFQASPVDYLPIEDAGFLFISDWLHFALLELLKTKSAESNPHWLALRLGIHVSEVTVALNRLEHYGYVQIKNDRYKLLKPNNNWVNFERTSEARKTLQKNLLAKAQQAIHEVPLELRENGSLTLAIDKSLIPIVKKKMADFRKDIDRLVSRKSGSHTDEVYQMCMAFFPLTKITTDITGDDV